MSAMEAPAIGSLDELAAATSADTHADRYQAGLARVLGTVPSLEPTVAHLTAWLIAAGVPAGQVKHDAGADGRVATLTAWARPQAEWLDPADLLLVIEVGKDGTEATAYATAGVEHYWTVRPGADAALVVHRLGPDGTYTVTTEAPLEWLYPMPLAWVL